MRQLVCKALGFLSPESHAQGAAGTQEPACEGVLGMVVAPVPLLRVGVACRSDRSERQEGERWLKHPGRCAGTLMARLSCSDVSVWEQPWEKGLPRGTLESPPKSSPNSPQRHLGLPTFALSGSKYQELHWCVYGG